MALRLYNTLTRRIEDFAPLRPGEVTIYVCGPTVYDEPHIGHARSAFVFDVLRRYLESTGLRVTFVRNVTDVDDKIIQQARQGLGTRDKGQGTRALQKACEEVAEKYLGSYHAALAKLGIQLPTIEPKATEHVVPEMTDSIAKLLMQGAAYEAKGDVYFSVRKFEPYGRLSNRTVDELQAGARVEPGEQKQDPLDFALWKAAKPGEPAWPSPWGTGRPGWHIECSAMSTKYLGDAFDIHGGGLDLIFPHHENEIAQAHAAGKPFATCWMHHGLLTVNGEKMSKSLGNFITLGRALQACGGEVDVLKTFYLGTHYRSPVDYAETHLHAAAQRWKNWMRVFDLAAHESGVTKAQIDAEAQGAFEQAMDDDVNTPKALAVLDQLATTATKQPSQAAAMCTALSKLGAVLGLFQQASTAVIPAEVQALVQRREQARHAKDFAAADRLRQEVAAKGFVIEDIATGPVVLPKR